MLCHMTKIVDGKHISGSIDTNGLKPNFTWKINDFWLLFNRKFYVVFLNTALRSNLNVFPETTTTVSKSSNFLTKRKKKKKKKKKTYGVDTQ